MGQAELPHSVRVIGSESKGLCVVIDRFLIFLGLEGGIPCREMTLPISAAATADCQHGNRRGTQECGSSHRGIPNVIKRSRVALPREFAGERKTAGWAWRRRPSRALTPTATTAANERRQETQATADEQHGARLRDGAHSGKVRKP